jgi:cell wall-associated NlpC family hydrolase
VIHSHPKPALPWPSKKDIECQHESAVPWGIVSTDGITASPPNWFGDHLLDVPLIGRQYVFGVFDCWSLVRSYQWQRFGIKMPDIPRDADEFRNGNSIFVDLIGDHRFRVRQVDNETLIPGDIIVMQIGRAKLPNHVAVMDTDGAMLHHSSEQLSRRDPFYGRWAKFMIRHVRHMDAPVDSHRR